MKLKNITNSLTLAAVGVFAIASVSLADGLADYYSQLAHQRFFNYQRSARSIGMGGSSFVTDTDSTSIFGNPAGLGFMENAEVSVNYARDYISGKDITDYDDVQFDLDSGYAVGAFPISPNLDGLPNYGNIAFGWNGARGSSDDDFDSRSRGYGIHLAYAKALSDTVSLGYGVSYMADTFKNNTGLKYKLEDGVRQNVGLMIKPNDKWRFGAMGFYGFGGPDVDTQAGKNSFDVWSAGADVGAAYMVSDATTLASSVDYTYMKAKDGSFTGLAARGDKEDGSALNARIGVEHKINDRISARLGYRYAANFGYDFIGLPEAVSQHAKFNGVSIGAGVNLTKSLRLDYGAEYRAVGDGDWTHAVSATVPFSICLEDYRGGGE